VTKPMLHGQLDQWPSNRHTSGQVTSAWKPRSLTVGRKGRNSWPRSVVYALRVIILVIIASSISVAQSTLPLAWQQKEEPGAFSKQRTIPRVDRGYLFSFNRRLTGPSDNNLVVRTLATGVDRQIPFWINQASEIRLEDVAIGVSGELYVAGSMLQENQMSLVNFVAQLDDLGKPLKILNLGSYRPKRLCTGGDGTFWTIGFGLGLAHDEGRGEKLLRHYSFDGQLLNGYLPSEKFPALSHIDFRRNSVLLSCGNASVGVYLAHPARWIEIPYNQQVVNKWRLQAIPPGRATGLTLRGVGEAFASFSQRHRTDDGTLAISSNIYRLTLPVDGFEQSSGQGGTGSAARLQSGILPRATWGRLATNSSESSTKLFLLGRDDQSLVYVGPKVPGVDPILYWSRP